MEQKIFWLYLETSITQTPHGIIFLTHGFRSHGLIHHELIQYFLERGYNVVVWDLPAHGRSDGEPGYLDEFRSCVRGILYVLAQTMHKNRHLPIHFISHSTGCSVATLALLYLYENKKKRIVSRIKSTVYVDPAFHVLHNVKKSIQRLAPIAKILLYWERVCKAEVAQWDPEGITADEHVTKIMHEDPYFYRGPLYLKTAYEIYAAGEKSWKALGNVKVCMHFIYGSRDEVTPPISEEDFALMPEGATLKTFQGQYHDPIDGEGSREVLDYIQQCILSS